MDKKKSRSANCDSQVLRHLAIEIRVDVSGRKYNIMAMRTPTRPYCLGTPSLYKCLMVKLSTTEPMAQLLSPEDFTLHGVWFDVRDRGFELAPVQMPLRAGITLYFIASEFAGYFYVLHYFKDLRRFGCSCKEGKQGHCCEHMKQMPEHA